MSFLHLKRKYAFQIGKEHTKTIFSHKVLYFYTIPLLGSTSRLIFTRKTTALPTDRLSSAFLHILRMEVTCRMKIDQVKQNIDFTVNCGSVLIMVDFMVRSLVQHVLPPCSSPSTGLSIAVIKYSVLHFYLTAFKCKMFANG